MIITFIFGKHHDENQPRQQSLLPLYFHAGITWHKKNLLSSKTRKTRNTAI